MTNLQDPCEIRLLREGDLPVLFKSFNELGWKKPLSLFKEYLNEQTKGNRLVWVAYRGTSLAGYVTLKWESLYLPFKSESIPEISDLNVLPSFRNQGAGTRLLDKAETAAYERSNRVGIGVGLYADYGSAQKLYVNRGYIPDGRGVTYNYQHVSPGKKVRLDDDLILWFIKNLAP